MPIRRSRSTGGSTEPQLLLLAGSLKRHIALRGYSEEVYKGFPSPAVHLRKTSLKGEKIIDVGYRKKELTRIS